MNPAKACEVVLRENDGVKINSLIDIGTAYVVGICGNNGEYIGEPPILVNKRTGETDVFYLPDAENFKTLESGVKLEVPARYRPNERG